MRLPAWLPCRRSSKRKYPSIKFVNAAVAGGAGTNARAVLATRLSANDPPDSWQAHAGQEIIGTYVAAKQVAPLDDFFNSSGFGKVLPPTLLPLISQDGHPYSVPVNIHRSNVMWYNPTVLTAAGVEVPATMDEFFAACEKIKAAGKICLSLRPAVDRDAPVREHHDRFPGRREVGRPVDRRRGLVERGRDRRPWTTMPRRFRTPTPTMPP